VLEEINFIADRLHQPFDDVSEIYHAKHDSLPETILELLDVQHKNAWETDASARKQLHDLSTTNSHVPEIWLQRILEITGKTTESASEVANVLDRHFDGFKHKRIDVNYTLTPLVDEEIDAIGTKATSPRGVKSPPVQTQFDRVPSLPVATQARNFEEAVTIANQFSQSADQSFASAAQAYRKGKSNPYFKQAASVYSERAREQARSAANAASAAADILVESRSSGNRIDLHGVVVEDGVRVALRHVRIWWEGLGEYRARKAKEKPFIIITGAGRHSVGGVSPLRKGVLTALVNEGWKIEVETAGCIVKGR
jgi:hypothetical protein